MYAQQICNADFHSFFLFLFCIFTVLVLVAIVWWLRKQRSTGAAADGKQLWENMQTFRSPNSARRFGLALSGGGIRSATFSLGVLQALARSKKLATFDYLSTVSGGGYIGSWLSAWIKRKGLFHVQTELARVGSRNGTTPDAKEPPEINWLRKYSNYLAPRLGLFSADSLTLVTTWLRNVFLNQIILIAFVATLLLIPRLLLKPTQWALQIRDCYGIAAAVLSILCIYFIGLNVDRDAKDTWRVGQNAQNNQNVNQNVQNNQNAREWPWPFTTELGVPIILLLAIFTAIFGSVWLFSADQSNAAAIFTRFGWLLLLVVIAWFIVGVIHNRCQSESQWRCKYAIIYLIMAIIGIFLPIIIEPFGVEVGLFWAVMLIGGLLILLGILWFVAEAWWKTLSGLNDNDPERDNHGFKGHDHRFGHRLVGDAHPTDLSC